MTLLEEERFKERQKQLEKEKLMFMDFLSKHGNNNLTGKIKKNPFCNFHELDKATQYIENELENNPQLKKIMNFKYKKDDTIENREEMKKNKKLYKIPTDLIDFLKKK